MRLISNYLRVLLLFFACIPASNAKDAIASTDKGFINWTKGIVVVNGYGAAPQGKEASGIGKLQARRAAVVEGYRNLAEVVHGVRVTSMSVVKDMMTQSDIIKTSINQLIKGAQVTGENYNDGIYRIELTMPLKSRFIGTLYSNESRISLNNAVSAKLLTELSSRIFNFFIPTAHASNNAADDISINSDEQYSYARKLLKTLRTNPSEAVKALGAQINQYEKNTNVTGLVIDARSAADFEMATIPNIRNTKGELLYPNDETSYDNILKKRPASYDFNMEDAIASKRVADHPIIVTSKSTYKSRHSDLVVPDEYSPMIKRLNKSGAVNKAKVIIVVAE